MTIAKKSTLDFAVEQIDVVQLDIAREPNGLLAGHDLMSPCVWKTDQCTRLLVRVLKNPLEEADPSGKS